MKLDLQKVSLRKLIETEDSEFYSKLSSSFFTGINNQIYQKIVLFFKANLRIPSSIELLTISKDESLQDYIEKQLFDETNSVPEISNEFLLSQLRDYFVRDETLSFIDKILDDISGLEQDEIAERFQTHLLALNETLVNSEELFDAGTIDFFPKADDFKLFSSGLSTEYDEVNGGFATQELVLLGGRRGSGKSIISLNAARHRFQQGNTVAVFSIEMRYKEVHDRLLSQISGVPFLDIYKNKLTDTQKITIAKAKFASFYQDSVAAKELLQELEETHQFKKFEEKLRKIKPPLKDNRLFIIDDPALSLNRIDFYCTDFKAKFPNFNMAVVDYLNIIAHKEQKDWKTQIEFADNLKLISRKKDLTLLSPYQIDASGEARFAKGILDSADRSFIFMPADAKGEVQDKINMFTSKIRNGKAMNFEVGMDWALTKVISERTQLITDQLLPAEKYGSEKAADIQ